MAVIWPERYPLGDAPRLHLFFNAIEDDNET